MNAFCVGICKQLTPYSYGYTNPILLSREKRKACCVFRGHNPAGFLMYSQQEKENRAIFHGAYCFLDR